MPGILSTIMLHLLPISKPPLTEDAGSRNDQRITTVGCTTTTTSQRSVARVDEQADV